MKTVKAPPGILIIEPLTTQKTSNLQLSPDELSRTRLRSGKVIAVGRNIVTDANALLEVDWYAKVGDVVWFLSYEGDYDNFFQDNQRYYAVKVQDLRAIV